MAHVNKAMIPKHMTYSKSTVPVLGAIIDYIETSMHYLREKRFGRADKLNVNIKRPSMSPTFLAVVCLFFGLVANVKFEIVTFDKQPLAHDLHEVLLSKEDKLYIDEIDVSRVMWSLEASDLILVLISTTMIFNSLYVRSPTREYLFLPWLGATLRGLFLRQAPTAGALIYTIAIVDGNVNPLFLTAFSFLFLLEARMWFEIARLVRSRWERRDFTLCSQSSQYVVETLWSNEDVQSVEVQNYVY